MKLVMNMVRKSFKKGDVIFDISEKSDDLYLINAGMVQIESSEGMVLATLAKGEMFGEMASILGERERTARTARAVALKPAVIDVIDSKTMQRRLGEADPVLRALVRNLTIRLADANELNERQWQMLKIYNSLSPGDIRQP
jgi:CRP-like cAMP-binding protein